MKATLVVSTLMGLTAAHVMPRGGGDYGSGDGVTTKVSAHPVSVPLSTGTAYPQGSGDDDDDDDYCDDEGDDSGDDDNGGDDGHGGHYTWPTIPVPQTTSTVTATSVYTVTSCAPTVTNCPVGHVTTEVVTDYTTYCPAPTGEITKYSTMMVTITECPKTVTNCPARTTASVSSCVYTPVPTEQTVYKTVTVPTCPAAQSGHGCWETHSEVQTSWYYAPPTTPAHSTETAYPVKTGQSGWGNGAYPTSTPGQTGWGNGAYPTTKPAGQGQGWGTGYTVPPTTVATTYAYGTGKAPVPTSTYAVTAGVGKVGFSAAAIIAGVAAFLL